jgi:hypothetical protein
MRKRDELTRPEACMVRARDDEMTFVLLGRDAAAPVAIRAWIAERIRSGKNRPEDPQIVEAGECARAMEAERPGGEGDQKRVPVYLDGRPAGTAAVHRNVVGPIRAWSRPLPMPGDGTATYLPLAPDGGRDAERGAEGRADGR